MSCMSDDQQAVCCNASHLLYVNVAFCHLSLEDFIHLSKLFIDASMEMYLSLILCNI